MCKMTGRDIKQMRNEYGFSQSYILDGYMDKRLDKPTLSKIENGIADPPESLCIHVCKLCGFSLNETVEAVFKPVATAAETRREAYHGMDKAKRRNDILAIMKDKPMTAREVAYALGFRERNAAAPRLTELFKAGVVEITGKRTDSITGRPVSVYRRKHENSA
jgi:DNA-binding XRE family transcriptional regulator